MRAKDVLFKTCKTPRCGDMLSLLGFPLSLTVVVFCFGCMQNDQGAGDLDSNRGPTLVGSVNHLWDYPNGIDRIPVCFVNDDGTSNEARTVREVVESEYSKAGICFAGWERCANNLSCPVIKVYLGVPEGAEDKWAGQGTLGPDRGCNERQWTIWMKRENVEWASLHEFGHSIGLSHEHKRSDTTEECRPDIDEKTIKEGEDIVFYTDYDTDSMMSYCGVQTKLSDLDIQGIQKLYGTHGRQCNNNNINNNNNNHGDRCYDNHENCNNWASGGECDRNPAYMLTECCASCRNVRQQIDDWGDNGMTAERSRQFMEETVRRRQEHGKRIDIEWSDHLAVGSGRWAQTLAEDRDGKYPCWNLHDVASHDPQLPGGQDENLTSRSGWFNDHGSIPAMVGRFANENKNPAGFRKLMGNWRTMGCGMGASSSKRCRVYVCRYK